MEISNLYGNFRYVAPYEWLINMDIREYDLKQANISVLKQMNILSDDLYNKLKNSEKMNREVYIGKMIRKNPDIVKAVKSGITEARRLSLLSYPDIPVFFDKKLWIKASEDIQADRANYPAQTPEARGEG